MYGHMFYLFALTEAEKKMEKKNEITLNELEGAARQQFLNAALLYVLKTQGPLTVPYDFLDANDIAGIKIENSDKSALLTAVTQEEAEAYVESVNQPVNKVN